MFFIIVGVICTSGPSDLTPSNETHLNHFYLILLPIINTNLRLYELLISPLDFEILHLLVCLFFPVNPVSSAALLDPKVKLIMESQHYPSEAERNEL